MLLRAVALKKPLPRSAMVHGPLPTNSSAQCMPPFSTRTPSQACRQRHKRLRTCSKSFRGSHWSAIGMSGSFGCAAWAGAHASSRSVQSPDFTPTLRAGALPGGLRRCGRLPIAGLLAAPRTLHSIPARYSCDPEKILNRFLAQSQTVRIERRWSQKVLVDAHHFAGALQGLPQGRRHLQYFFGRG